MNLGETFKLISPYEFLNDNFYDQAYPDKFPKTIIRYRNRNFEEFDHLSDNEWIKIFGVFDSKLLPKKKKI